MHVGSMQGMVGNALEGERRCGSPPGGTATGVAGLRDSPGVHGEVVIHGELLGSGGLHPGEIRGGFSEEEQFG